MILYYTVVTFRSQPVNVTTVIGGQAYFPCTYEGSSVAPSWRIVDKNGEARDYTITTLPVNHYYTGDGLLLRNIDKSLNLTVYSCFLKFHIAGYHQISSSNATLNILNPVTFEISTGDNEHPNLIIGEGLDEKNFFTITRKANTNFTFTLSLVLESLQGNLTGE